MKITEAYRHPEKQPDQRVTAEAFPGYIKVSIGTEDLYLVTGQDRVFSELILRAGREAKRLKDEG